MIDMNKFGCYCKGITNHLHVLLYKGDPQTDMKPLDPSPFLRHGSNEPPAAHDLPKAGQQACQTWSEKTSKCSLTSHAVELRVSFEMELTESQQTIYRQAVANAADVHRDEVSISNLAVLEDGDEMSEPVRRVSGNESLEFDTIVAAANTRHLPLPSLHRRRRHRLLFLLFLLVLLVLLVLVLLVLLVLLSPLCLIVACRLMPTGGVNSPLLSCSALPRAHETLTYYSAGSCRSHAQEMARRLTEDTINQELMRLGLPNAAMIKAPSVVAWGGGQLFGQGQCGLGGGDLRSCCSAAALRVCLLLLEEEEILLERPNGSVSAGRNAARRWRCESFSSGRNSFGRSLTYRVVCPGYCMPTRSKVSDQRLSIQAG